MSRHRGGGQYINPEKLNQTFDYIVQYKREHDGMSPTVREIMAAISFNTTSMVNYLLDILEEQGRIVRVPNASRSISIPGGSWVYSLSPEEDRNVESVQEGSEPVATC